MKIKSRSQDISVLAQTAPLPVLGLLGGFASCTAETCTFPLDNIKTRMQMNGKQGLPTYTGLFDCIRKTIQNQGVFGFYRGLSASLLRQMPYSAVRIYTYEGLKRIFTGDVEEVPFLRKLAAGGIAGAVGCVFGTPGDILKIRMINDPAKQMYGGLMDCAKKTLEVTGYQGFLKGFWVNVCRAFIVNACELATYDTFKGIFVRKFDLNPDKFTTHMCASTMAGFVAAVCSSPVDVVKTRYMNQLQGETNIFKVVVDIFQKEGTMAFYKGFTPYFFRITPWTILMFTSFEQYKKIVLPRIME